MVTLNVSEDQDFEQLYYFQDRDSGLKAIIVIHNTKLGPALGGCRLWEYVSEEDAIVDAIRLAQGMTYKCAIAGLPYGGGKAVVMGDPSKGNHKLLFRALGRFINTLQGRYITGIDLGTTVADMDMVKMDTNFVTDISGSLGATGNFTAEMTAYGVFLSIQASLNCAMSSKTLKDRIVAVQGLGKVGYFLCRYLKQAGAQLIVTDIDKLRVEKVVEEFDAKPVQPNDIYNQICDVFSPCALGGVLNDVTLAQLRCAIVAGAANNQLAEPRHGEELQKLGILYAPDYVINAGGIIVTASELTNRNAAHAKQNVSKIDQTLRKVFDHALAQGIPTSTAADQLTEQILATP
jgi:leucine dehydrogenase